MALLRKCFKCRNFIILPSKDHEIELTGYVAKGQVKKIKHFCNECQRDIFLNMERIP